MEAKTREAREKKKELMADAQKLDKMIAEGCERARNEARKTLEIVRSHMKW